MLPFGKKAPPKRNKVPQNALYAPQFMGILAIGTCCEAGLPSVIGVYDGGRARGDIDGWGYVPGLECIENERLMSVSFASIMSIINCRYQEGMGFSIFNRWVLKG